MSSPREPKHPPDPALTINGDGHRSSDSVQPNTTAQEDLTTAGQRRVNLIWEYTQAIIAAGVSLATVSVSVFIAVTKGEFPQVLISAFFLIVGFYFSRTNHAAIGGTGRKPSQPYQGR